MEETKLLLEDYKRKLSTITKELEKGGNDLTINRLGTKASCYRTFISELEKVLAKTSKSHKVTRRTLRDKYYEGYRDTSFRAGFGLQNFVTNGYIEPIVEYLKSKGINVNE